MVSKEKAAFAAGLVILFIGILLLPVDIPEPIIEIPYLDDAITNWEKTINL